VSTIPYITHIQFAVLNLLRSDSWVSATGVRKGLAAYGDTRKGPAFYQLMRRLQVDGMLDAERNAFSLGGGEPVYRTYYRSTVKGVQCCQETMDFYNQFRV
jgi:hypothetical protein